MVRLGLLALLLPLWLQVPEPGHEAASGNRDEWQRPAAIMDTLRIRPGTRVADIGAGTGYFTFHLARRVGAGGLVYAEDIQPAALAAIGRRASGEGLKQIRTVQGTDEDPRLPPGAVDVVLVVNTYHEFRAFDSMMQGFRQALKPGGLLAIIDCEAPPGELPGKAFRYHRISSRVVRGDAERAGFRYVRTELGFVDPDAGLYSSYWFFLIFERPL